jgi:hypothetical protein
VPESQAADFHQVCLLGDQPIVAAAYIDCSFLLGLMALFIDNRKINMFF